MINQSGRRTSPRDRRKGNCNENSQHQPPDTRSDGTSIAPHGFEDSGAEADSAAEFVSKTGTA
jgi:hypothetical protein